MKKPYIKLLGFIALMIILVSGLTYLSLNHVTKTKDKEVTKKMNVALVNEDEGTKFNDDALHFGDAFVKSMEKDDTQNWHIVSRGIAENGLENGTYDMMVIIPNEFSKRALSINEEAPEPVVLDYKVNASENDKVQAEAKETVGSILNDFNTRIIDVYFASVIGNLQEAQDNVAALVAEDAKYKNMYNGLIHEPLSSYTEQFETVKTSSQASKDSFKSYEDLMAAFEEGLNDKLKTSEDYQSNIAEAEKVMEKNRQSNVNFMDQLEQYNSTLHNDNMNEQLQKLQVANDYINAQFNNDQQNRNLSNIAGQTTRLKSRLQESLEKIDETNQQLNALLEASLIDDEIVEEIETIIANSYDVDDGLSDLLSARDKDLRKKINKHIKQIPTMNKNKVEDADLSTEMKQEIKNVITVTENYIDDIEPVSTRERDILTDHVEVLIQHLKNDGITITDTVELPKNKKSGQEFTLHDIPKAFNIEYLNLKLPNQPSKNYKRKRAKQTIQLPANEQGKFTVELKLTLKDKYEESLKGFDIYNEIAGWGWSLYQTDLNDELSKEDDVKTVSYYRTNTKLVASAQENKVEKQTAEDEGANPEKEPEGEDENTEGEGANPEEETGNTGGEEGNSEDEDETPKEDEKPEDEDEDEEDEEEEEVEKVEVINNQIHHKVTQPVIDESTVNLINAVENTITPYQNLLPLYEAYFGFDLTCGSDDCGSFKVKGDATLQDVAKKQSLYYLFNKANIKDLMSDYILNQIEEEVKSEIDAPIVALKNDMDHYRNFVQETDKNAKQLVDKVIETRGETRQLNQSIEKTLANITDWREDSSQLLTHQTEQQSNFDEGEMAVTGLTQEFQPLLTQSQSLRDQSLSNLETTEQVYRTFDTVDEQATKIQQSGTDLVQQADNLKTNMTNKMIEDEQFVENFSGVLENSRIGDQPNEELYDFLSSPVDTENKGLMIKGDTFTPYFLVLIGFIVALFTGYVISTTAKRRHMRSQFDGERSLIGSNSLITGITAGIGVLEGLIIGILSANYLDLSQGRLIIWTGLMILVMLSMVFLSAYLLRQLHMVGMFILLVVMSMYLFLTKALGSGFSEGAQLRAYSPLQYVENMLSRFMQGNSDYQPILFGIIILIVLGVLGNLFVFERSQKEVAEDETDATNTQA